MSRSKKKNGWVKDPANSYMKPISSRRMRRKVKVLLHLASISREEPMIPDRRVVINQYDVCDYIFSTNDLRK